MEIKVPVLPESIADATVSKWYKQAGDAVRFGENLVDLETDKVMLEVPSPVDGQLTEIKKPEGKIVKADEVLAVVKEGALGKASKPVKQETLVAPELGRPAVSEAELSPAVRRLVAEHDIDIRAVKGTGKRGRVTKADVEGFLRDVAAKGEAVPEFAAVAGSDRTEQRVPMSRLRARVAERLVEVTQTTAMLTTFNEINMQRVMALRARHKEEFEKAHGVKLGLMSFFIKALIDALKHFPNVNASIDGADIVYHGYFDIGVAVSTERGLVVPILRDADRMEIPEIERCIRDYAEKARSNKLTLEEMTGGTFTITNGGVFGSMLSTPIINAPQAAILGMHNVVDRPIVEDDEIVIRPIMYVALSYDHRLIDGRDAVLFLRTIKETIEDPANLLLEL